MSIVDAVPTGGMQAAATGTIGRPGRVNADDVVRAARESKLPDTADSVVKTRVAKALQGGSSTSLVAISNRAQNP